MIGFHGRYDSRAPHRRVAAPILPFLFTVLAACGGGETAPAPVPTILQISPATVNLGTGETRQLSATVLDQNGQPMAAQSLAWSSSDSTIVSVSAIGLARGVRPGNATITARSGSLSGSATAAVGPPSFTLEESASASARLDAAGGTITATASNGVRYRLAVPPRALRDTVTITLTPVGSLGGVALHGAARFRPSGLRFSVPATLTVELPAAPANPADVVGFHFSDDRRQLSRYPVFLTGRELRTLVTHFSGVGAAGAALAPALSPSQDPETQMSNAVCGAAPDVSKMINAFRDTYTTLVKPALQAGTENTLVDALELWRYWRLLIALCVPQSGQAQVVTALATELSDSRSVAATALRSVITTVNTRCIATHNYSEAALAALWYSEAVTDGLDIAQFGLDLPQLLQGFCVQVRHLGVTLPDTVRPGRAATLRVQVGLSIGGAAPVFVHEVDVQTTPTRSTDDVARTARADGTGVVTRQVTPADTLEMRVQVHSCHDIVGVFDVCGDEEIRRTPTNALYFNTFSADSAGSEWSFRGTSLSPSGQRFLGLFGSQSGSLTLTALPAHTQLVLEFDLYIIDSWNGNGSVTSGSAPDVLSFEVAGGPVLKRTTFSNKPRDPQAFPGDFPGGTFAAGTGAFLKDALGYPPGSDHFGDTIYRLKLVFPHTSGSITLLFGGQQSSGQNEKWGLDNVRLSLAP